MWRVAAGIAVLGLGITGALLLRPRNETIPMPTDPFVLENLTVPEPAEEFFPLSPDSAVEAEKPDEAGKIGKTKPRKETLPVGHVQVGRLIYEVEGKRVAEETYRLARRPEGVEIVSAGSFSVKFLFMLVTVNFSQEIFLDPDF